MFIAEFMDKECGCLATNNYHVESLFDAMTLAAADLATIEDVAWVSVKHESVDA
jgi:hypothetical protein